MAKTNAASAAPMHSLWSFFASVKLSVVVLLSLAATSIVGTVIPQNADPRAYVQTYGELLYRIFYVLDIFDMYHSWWFQFLMVMLTLNVVVCSLDRFPGTWKFVAVKRPAFNLGRFRGHSDRQEFTAQRSVDHLHGVFEPVIAKKFSYHRIEESDKGVCILAERGRWTRLGVYVVHLSVVLLLLGGLIGSIFGFDGFVNIPEGESVSSIQLRNSDQPYNLDFEIRCDDFDVSFYESGAPKEYRSTLTITEQGQPVLSKDIIVNDPLRYKGVNMFQSSYGTLAPKEMTLDFTHPATGKSYQRKTGIGQPVELPEGKGTFLIKDYSNSFKFRGHNIGEAFLGILSPKEGEPVQVVLPTRFPSFDKMRKGEFIISVKERTQRFYTGLQVTNDPGVWVVYLGFLAMIIGCFITFFISHERLFVEIAKSGKKTRVTMAGSASKNKLGMQRKVETLSEQLAALAQGG